jgi:TolA-binding protein
MDPMNRPDFDPNNDKALDAWDPGTDRDPGWVALQDALREAEASHRPAHPADVESMRAALKSQLRAEGLLKGTADTPKPSPWRWVRALLLEGGMPAQVLRLGMVAAIALVVAREPSEPAVPLKRDVTPAMPMLKDSMLAGADPKLAEAQESIRQDAPPAGPDSEAAAAPPAVSGTIVPSARIASAPGEIRVEVMGTPGTEAIGEHILSSSYQRSTVNMQSERKLESYAAEAAAELGGANRPAAPQAGAASAMTLAASDGTRTRRQSPVTQADLLGDALERLQAIRLHATLKDDAPTLAEVRVIEPILSTLLRESEARSEAGAGSASAEALDKFRLGEQAIADRRYTDALAHFSEAQALGPRTFTGFLAEYMMAEVRYDYLEDYDAALAGYQRCLQGYPPEFVSEENRRHILERVELMTRASAGGWADLRLWTASQRSDSPEDEAAVLILLLREDTSSTLAAKAAERLCALLLEDAGRNSIDLAEALSALEYTVSQRPPGADTARIQFALAELVFKRAMDLPRATAEYRKALALEPSPELRALIGQRAQQLAAERLVPGAPDKP